MVNSSVDNSEKIKTLFTIHQQMMLAELQGVNIAIDHSPTLGDASELKWINWLSKYLPERYCVDKAFIIDSVGNLSEQIDLVIYDRQYTPFIFNDENAKYIPAESVYAVFEIKQNLNKHHMDYAAHKAETVRVLKRTSVPIKHAGGEYAAVEPKEIIAGILTLHCDWKDGLSTTFEDNLRLLQDNKMLNLGCGLSAGAFHVNKIDNKIEKSSKEESLIYFFLKLLVELQNIGTVPAIDIQEYGKNLTNF